MGEDESISSSAGNKKDFMNLHAHAQKIGWGSLPVRWVFLSAQGRQFLPIEDFSIRTRTHQNRRFLSSLMETVDSFLTTALASDSLSIRVASVPPIVCHPMLK
jgi:hypothetical protein